MDSTKEYIKDLVHNIKKVLPLKDDLDKIIERSYEKAFEILDKYGIIEYIESKYIKKALESLHKFGIIEDIESKYTNYKKPKLEILEDYISKNEPSIAEEVAGEYSIPENKITISKKFIESYIDSQLEFLDHYEGEIKRSIDKILRSLGYKGSNGDIQDIGYLYMANNSIFLYPSYINKKNKRESIAEAISLFTMFHEDLHSLDDNILNTLDIDNILNTLDIDNILNTLDIDNILNTLDIDFIIKNDSTIKYIYYLLNILDNPELRASAFEVVMYYLANGFHKDIKGYIAAYFNILKCGNYIKEANILENNGYNNIVNPYDLGRCYGNIIVATNKSSLEENIYDIIDDIIHLDKKRAIEVIKYYVYNPDKLLQD